MSYLQAVPGLCEQRGQLSETDSEPSAPSLSLALAEVCGWSCLTRLEMSRSSHLKQRQTCALRSVPVCHGTGRQPA